MYFTKEKFAIRNHNASSDISTVFNGGKCICNCVNCDFLIFFLEECKLTVRLETEFLFKIESAISLSVPF